ncbi:hypothetical protein [Parapedobacter sp.]
MKGISSKALSRILTHKESYVTTIENPNRDTQYPPHEYPGLAKALDWTVEDLLPPDNWDAGDGTKVEKIVLSLANPEDTRLVLEGMIEDGFFNKPKTLAEVVKHLYIDREDKKEERQVLGGVLGDLVREGKLTVANEKYLKND